MDAPEGIALVEMHLDCEEQEQMPRVLATQPCPLQCTRASAICKFQLFSGTEKQQQLHHRMKKREVDQEELASTCLCTLAPLYPSTTFAVHCSFPEHTGYKQRWHGEIMAIVSFVCC
jgi:hypothetical protein